MASLRPGRRGQAGAGETVDAVVDHPSVHLPSWPFLAIGRYIFLYSGSLRARARGGRGTFPSSRIFLLPFLDLARR